MSRIFRAAVVGSLVFALITTGAILIGQQNPAQIDFFNYFNTCDGQPCYLKLVPGKTSWDAMLTFFEDHPGLRFDPMMNVAANPLGFQGSVLIFAASQDQTVVDEIDLSMRSSSVTIGSLVERFGSPCAVAITTNAGMGVIFPGMEAFVNLNVLSAQILRPTTLVYEISLFSQVNSCAQVIAGDDAAFRWNGFARYTN